MGRYRVQLYNVPDKDKYASLPIRAWRAAWSSSLYLKLATLCVLIGLYLLVFVR